MASQDAPKGRRARDPTVAAINRIRKEREARRQSAEHYHRERRAEERRNIREGKPGDVDFQRLISNFRREHAGKSRKHVPPGQIRVCVAVRKRPINEREKATRDHDAVTTMNPRVAVHACKLRVDGITKYLENQMFEFDHTFGDADDTRSVYHYTVQPLVALMFKRGGRGTCFAYGQTGSGKTYTMTRIQDFVARDIFRLQASAEHSRSGLQVHLTMFEIYGGRCSDLLHDRAPVTIREDGAGKVQTVGLTPVRCDDEAALIAAVEAGNESRTTHATAMNEVSSRSHSICEVMTTDDAGNVVGSLTLIDLAGSERAADRSSHNRQRRMESAEINKSLLALKECIRAMDSGSSHVPFRASKLTLALKDNFTARGSRTVMIAAVSPAASSADHTQNTLRYAERVKQKPAGRAAPRGGRAGLAHPVASDLAFLQASASEEGAGEIGGSGGASARGRMGDRRGAGAGGAGDSGRDARGLRTSPVTVDADDEDEDGMGGGRVFDAEYDGDGPSLAHVYGREEEEEAAAAAEAEAAAAAAAARAERRRGPAAAAGRRGRGAPAASSGAGSASARRGEAGDAVTPRGGAAGGGFARDGGRGGSRLQRGGEAPPSRAHLDRPRPRMGRAGGDGKEADDEADEPLSVLAARRAAAAGAGAGAAAGRGARSPISPSDGDDVDAGVADEFRRVDARGIGDGESRSSPKRDLAFLSRTLKEEGALGGGGAAAEDGERWLEFQEVMDRIVEEEEELLASHMGAIQENAHMLTEEGQLLSKVQGRDVVDYDIDGYAARLDALLRKKLATTEALLKQLTVFRKHLLLEDEMARRGVTADGEA